MCVDVFFMEVMIVCCFCFFSIMVMDIMDTFESMAISVSTSFVRVRMDSEMYIDCVLGIFFLCVCSLY